MIENRIQHGVTLRQIQRFKDAMAVLREAKLPADVDPAFRQIELDAMQSVVDEMQRDVESYEDEHKRFFECDDNGNVHYSFVVFDIDHAKHLLREAKLSFEDYYGKVCTFEDATWLEWSEISPQKADTITVRDDDNNRSMLLSNCRVGDWFSSEW